MTKTAAPMTSGSIWKQMTFFAMPIFLGNLFQQLYNTVEISWGAVHWPQSAHPEV
jgi:Na+-driven multidrug efflux pump